MDAPDVTPEPAVAAARASTAETVLVEFAARVAHDFNNLLTAILGNLELLQLRAANQKLPGLNGYLEAANSAGSRAVALAARLMIYSGQCAGAPVMVPVDEVLERFSARAACSLAGGGAALHCDPAQLELAVAELLDNAEAAGGAVSISSAPAGRNIIVTVRDTGCGMEPAVLQRATEPFFSTAANCTGRGLGLPIVARVVRELGGSMDIAAQPGAGCTVTLTFLRA